MPNPNSAIRASRMAPAMSWRRRRSSGVAGAAGRTEVGLVSRSITSVESKKGRSGVAPTGRPERNRSRSAMRSSAD